MTISLLAGLLDRMGAPTGAYSIGSVRNESYCLVREHQDWLVFYSERGARNDERAFRSEPEACRDLIDRLLRDSISRGAIRRSWTR